MDKYENMTVEQILARDVWRLGRVSELALERGDMELAHEAARLYHELADLFLTLTGSELRPVQ